MMKQEMGGQEIQQGFGFGVQEQQQQPQQGGEQGEGLQMQQVPQQFNVLQVDQQPQFFGVGISGQQQQQQPGLYAAQPQQQQSPQYAIIPTQGQQFVVQNQGQPQQVMLMQNPTNGQQGDIIQQFGSLSLQGSQGQGQGQSQGQGQGQAQGQQAQAQSQGQSQGQGQQAQGQGRILHGVVKRWNLEKGYGFIQPVEGGDDVFVHHTVIHSKGFRSLLEGSEVEYECVEVAPSRVRATRVTGPSGTYCKAAPRPVNPPLVGHGATTEIAGQPVTMQLIQLPSGQQLQNTPAQSGMGGVQLVPFQSEQGQYQNVQLVHLPGNQVIQADGQMQGSEDMGMQQQSHQMLPPAPN